MIPEIAAPIVRTSRKEIRRRVRRQVMLRRLDREIAAGQHVHPVSRRPFPS